mmetsp:Transcript_23263/g.37025  ORF Transcript_23263/g.37025 Transcript_23263/m.37025 type:complete len:640 (-) Transcript_23263:1241-3160(-)
MSDVTNETVVKQYLANKRSQVQPAPGKAQNADDKVFIDDCCGCWRRYFPCCKHVINANRSVAGFQSCVVFVLLALIVGFMLWSVGYVEWNISAPGYDRPLVIVNFKKYPRCVQFGNYFAREIENIQVLGGSTTSWEEVVRFPNTLTEQILILKDSSSNETNKFLTLQAGMAFWLPNYLVRTLTLNTISRTEKTITVDLNMDNRSVESCDIEWYPKGQLARASQVALIDYLMKYSKQVGVEIYDYMEADLENPGGNSSVAHGWQCSYWENATMRPPSEVCAPSDSVSVFKPSYVLLVVIWLLLVLIGVCICAVVIVRFFQYQAAKSNLAINPLSRGSIKRVRNKRLQSYPLRSLLSYILFFERNKGTKPVNIATIIQNLCLKLFPIYLPFAETLFMGCAIRNANCDRKESIQIPLVSLMCVFVLLVYIETMLRIWSLQENKLYVYYCRGLRVLSAFFLLFSVALALTNILWVIVACSVNPVGAGSKLVAIFSICLYAHQTWSRLSQSRRELISSLEKGGEKYTTVAVQLKACGATQAQLLSFVWLSTLGLILLFVWITLSSTIFLAQVPGGEDSPFFAFLTGFLIPFAASLSHIYKIIMQRKHIEASTFKTATESTINELTGSNLSSELEDLEKSTETIK